MDKSVQYSFGGLCEYQICYDTWDMTDCQFRRLPGVSTPLKAITNLSSELQSIEAAAAKPKLVLLGDWTNFSSSDYFDAEVKTNMDLL